MAFFGTELRVNLTIQEFYALSFCRNTAARESSGVSDNPCKDAPVLFVAARRCGSTDDEDAGGFDSFRRRPKSFCITGPPPPPTGPHPHMAPLAGGGGPMGRKVKGTRSESQYTSSRQIG